MNEVLQRLKKSVEVRRGLACDEWQMTNERTTVCFLEGLIDAYKTVEKLIDKEMEKF